MVSTPHEPRGSVRPENAPPVADLGHPAPVEDDAGFSIDVASTRPGRDYWRIGGGVFISAVIVLIVVLSVTDLSSRLLPMEDRYLEVLIPESEEGVLPLALEEIANVLEENRISVSGRVANMSLEPVENVVAVISARETTGRFPEVVEVPVQPALIEPGESGDFSVSVTLRQRPDSYTVRFKLENGPFVPHSDARAPSINILEAP